MRGGAFRHAVSRLLGVVHRQPHQRRCAVLQSSEYSHWVVDSVSDRRWTASGVEKNFQGKPETDLWLARADRLAGRRGRFRFGIPRILFARELDPVFLRG